MRKPATIREVPVNIARLIMASSLLFAETGVYARLDAAYLTIHHEGRINSSDSLSASFEAFQCLRVT
jgi:hypothetical protein